MTAFCERTEPRSSGGIRESLRSGSRQTSGVVGVHVVGRWRRQLRRQRRMVAQGRGETYCYDLPATILRLLGIDHEKLTFHHNGIDRRLTDVHGHVIKEIMA